MKTRVQRWGNSLALRIPKSFADDAGLDHGALVDVSLVEGRLVVTPVTAPSYTLDELVAGITDENRHGEEAIGPSVGNEAW